MNITLYFPDQSEMEMDFPIVPRIGEQLAFPVDDTKKLEWYEITNIAHYTSKKLNKVMFVAAMLKRIL